MTDLERAADAALVDIPIAPAPRDRAVAPPPDAGRPPADAPPPVLPFPIVARHPALFLAPCAWTVHAARALQRHSVPVVVLAASRLDPAGYVRGVRRQHLPPFTARPERWQARLLELAATLEPRPAVYAGSMPALELLQCLRRTLEPHYELPDLHAADVLATGTNPDTALGEALARSEAALEVQMVLDAGGRTTGGSVLAWAAGAPPDVLVTSVAGTEVLSRSEDWLVGRRRSGYARLIWSPDRFGRLTLQASGSVPGPGLVLAAADGVDFAFLAHAAAFGLPVVPQWPACRLVRRLVRCETAPGAPLEIATPLSFEWRDPLPSMAAFLRGLRRT